MKASDAIALVLAENNVTYGFELIGGMITHIVDSINQLGRTKLVSMHHEQGAAFAAGAIARGSSHNQLGVALGTSGPGATNLITGIADCWLDSHPCVFITGQVNSYELKGNLNIRQQGFQELDSVALVKSITKYAVQVTKVENLIPELQKAINIAREGRPGPVLLDITMDVQRDVVDKKYIEYLNTNDIGKVKKTTHAHEPDDLENIFNEINLANAPLILIGGGAVNLNGFNNWLDKLQELKIPYVASLKGAEKIQQSDQYYGMIGAYGTRTANYAIQNCDLLIVLGSRLEVRQTGAKVDDFARNAKIIQIDLEKDQLNNRVKCSVSYNLDVSCFFKVFIKEFNYIDKIGSWRKTLKRHFKLTFVNEYQGWSLSPFDIFSTINEFFINKNVQYVADVGNNQMWAAHTLRMNKNQAAHYSGGLGTMGFAIPTAIGLHYSTKMPVVIITGDGGAQLNIQELDIIAREKLPILILVFNNYSLGMVRGFQEMYFNGRNDSTYWNGYSTEFIKISEAYNIKAKSVKDINELNLGLDEFYKNKKPYLLEIIIPDAKECRPRLEFGNSIDKQSPCVEVDLK